MSGAERERGEHHHQIDYIELYAADLERALGFYEAAFGWAFERWGEDYVAFRDGRLEGGIARDSERAGSRGGALVILYSSGLEDTRGAVVEAGGQIVREIFSFPGGRRFHFTDPEGNELAVWSQP